MKKSIKNTIMAGTLVVAIAVSGALAYLTDTDEAVNTFTVGEVNIGLSEPNWDATEAENVWSGKTIEKDPQVTNEGENKAYIYLAVEIPKANVITADAAGNKLPQQETQLFTLNELSESWTEIDRIVDEGAASNFYLFAYNEEVAPGASTEALFKSVTVANLIEGQIVDNPNTTENEAAMNINVTAYAIQSQFDDDSESTKKTPAQAWALFANQHKGEELPFVSQDTTP